MTDKTIDILGQVLKNNLAIIKRQEMVTRILEKQYKIICFVEELLK